MVNPHTRFKGWEGRAERFIIDASIKKSKSRKKGPGHIPRDFRRWPGRSTSRSNVGKSSQSCAKCSGLERVGGYTEYQIQGKEMVTERERKKKARIGMI